MKIAPFETEHFFAEYEFNTPHQLCNSDCETMTISELLELSGISIEELGRLPLGYTESQGHPELRSALASGYDGLNGLSADEFLVLGTPVEGIYLTARALLEPDDEVIVLTPAYDALVNVFEHVVGKGNVKKWELSPTEKSWALDLEKLKSLISDKTKLVVVNFPHNPTGFLPTPSWMNDLIGVIEANDLWLFCDEMYFGLTHSGTEPIPSAAELSERAIVLSGLSKTYGLPGLRSGWLIVRNQVIRDNFMNWKFYTSICPPAPSEFLAMAAWKVRDELRARSVQQIETNLAIAEPFFERWNELFHFRPPMAGSIALIDMQVPSVSKLAAELAKSDGVLIQSGVTLGASDQTMRMGFGRATFSQALDKFEAALGKPV